MSGSTRRMMLLAGGLGALFLVVVICLAWFLQPQMVDPDSPQPEQPAPAAPDTKPPLN